MNNSNIIQNRHQEIATINEIKINAEAHQNSIELPTRGLKDI